MAQNTLTVPNEEVLVLQDETAPVDSVYTETLCELQELGWARFEALHLTVEESKTRLDKMIEKAGDSSDHRRRELMEANRSERQRCNVEIAAALRGARIISACWWDDNPDRLQICLKKRKQEWYIIINIEDDELTLTSYQEY